MAVAVLALVLLAAAALGIVHQSGLMRSHNVIRRRIVGPLKFFGEDTVLALPRLPVLLLLFYLPYTCHGSSSSY